jgi:hypothetical protein
MGGENEEIERDSASQCPDAPRGPVHTVMMTPQDHIWTTSGHKVLLGFTALFHRIANAIAYSATNHHIPDRKKK